MTDNPNPRELETLYLVEGSFATLKQKSLKSVCRIGDEY